MLDRRLEMIGLRADGSEFPIELTVTRHPGVGAPQFTAVIRDIGKRRQAERLLAQQEATLRAVTEALAAYVERQDWRTAMARLLAFALEQTGSEYGFLGVVVDGTLRVLDIDLTRANDLARAYAGIDFESGNGEFVLELEAVDGRLQGYAKPLFQQIQIFSWRNTFVEALNPYFEGTRLPDRQDAAD